MSARPQRARSYRLRGPRVFRWAVCGPDSLQVVGKARVRFASALPGTEGLTERRNGLAREGNEASHRVPVSLHNEGISSVTNPAEDVPELPG